MAIGRELEVQITGGPIAPRERERVVDRPGVKRPERDRAAERLAAMDDPLATERDDLDRLADGTRGVLRRIVIGGHG